MSMNVKDVLAGIDWPRLREQKLVLIRMANDEDIPLEDQDALAGVVHLIDALQDAVVDEGLETEAEVFGELEGG